MAGETTNIPILDLSWAEDPVKKPELLQQLHSALFEVGFLYITNHGVEQQTIDNLTNLLPSLFALTAEEKASLSKLNSPHFLGYSGFAEETTLGKKDLREQFDFATELPVVYQEKNDSVNGVNGHSNHNESMRDFSKLYWRLRGPNQWPRETSLHGFRKAFTEYHNSLQELSYRFVHLIEEAFSIPIGTFDHFFGRSNTTNANITQRSFLPPQHRIKLLRYPPAPRNSEAQGVGAHKDSSGWLTFLYQVSSLPGLEVLSPQTSTWLPIAPIPGSFVVNFGNAFEAATEGAVRATIHRVISPGPDSDVRYSIPFFQGLPLDMSVSEVRGYIPEKARNLRRKEGRANDETQSFLDPRWDSLGESQFRKWIRSHKDVALKWYGQESVDWYTASD